MRYVLMFLGFFPLLAGGLMLIAGDPRVVSWGAPLLLAGAILFAIGGATCDIVEAIKGGRGPRE